MEREKLGSRLGFILLSAGCAIGLGNVWKFPSLVAASGGGFFVLFYILFLLILGLPVMAMEFSLGRASQKSPVKMLKTLEQPKQKWHLYGYFAMAGNWLLMMFYTAVCGWMLQYFVNTAKGDFVGLDVSAIGAAFGNMVGDWKTMLIYTVIIIIGGFLVCSIGLQKGLERVTKYMMLALLFIMVGLAVYSCLQPGSSEGLKFYLMPSVENMKNVGIGRVIVNAMNQAFFTLSLGIGSMAIFGSYLKKDHSLLGEAVNVGILDTFVAITSGLIIFPACFAYDVPLTDAQGNLQGGPGLIFEVLPNLFANLPGGRIVGSLFFAFLFFAAFSTVLAVFENIIAMMMDLTGFSRKKTCLLCCPLMLVLCLPCVLGFNVLSNITPLGAGSNLMDLEDFIVSNVLLPVGSLVFAVFCTAKFGWGWKNFKAEANEGNGLKVQNWMRVYMTYILPLIIFALFVVGIWDKFFK